MGYETEIAVKGISGMQKSSSRSCTVECGHRFTGHIGAFAYAGEYEFPTVFSTRQDATYRFREAIIDPAFQFSYGFRLHTKGAASGI